MSESLLQAIPVFDARDVGVIGHLAAQRDAALELRRATLNWFPGPVRRLAPAVEAVNGWWLRRNVSPYRDEVFEMARVLGEPGVIAMNTSYEWACTTLGAASRDGDVALYRTLDWPFPGLGKGVQVARMSGRAGEYWNVTWPGAVGVLTAMAPGRFAVALNQAPLRRRTRGEWLRPADFAINAGHVLFGVHDMPAIHLLRLACEEAADINAALDLLTRTPVARPCIVTLVGCKADETFVVEKGNGVTRVLRQAGASANAFRASGHAGMWEPRPCGCSFVQAPANNQARMATLDRLAPAARSPFQWVEPPILNVFTRLAVEANPAAGRLRVRGYESASTSDLPGPATLDFDLVV